jgi:biotin transport system ATP-binding protein
MTNTALHLVSVTKRFRVVEDRAEDCKNSQIENGFFYALKDITFDIEKKSCTIIAGANGSGKSILMSIIAGLDEVTSGTVETNGTVGLVFQDAESQILGESAREDIAIGVRSKIKSERNFIVEKALKDTDLSDKADFPSHFLSGGEKRRLSIAGVLAIDADILIFDEPYAALDYPSVIEINKIILELKSKDKTIIILSHELEKCLALCNKFIVLEHGKIVFNSGGEDALAQDLTKWDIHNPLAQTKNFKDLVWLP